MVIKGDVNISVSWYINLLKKIEISENKANTRNKIIDLDISVSDTVGGDSVLFISLE